MALAPAPAPCLRLPISPQLRLACSAGPQPHPARLPAVSFRLLPPHRAARCIRMKLPPIAATEADSFSGWDGNGEAADGSTKGWVVDFIGAGLAGVFFVGGVAFAALSLYSKSVSGSKVQMEPLFKEQVIALSLDGTSEQHDDHNTILEHHNCLNGSCKEGCNLENPKGTTEDHSYLDAGEDYADRNTNIVGDTGSELLKGAEHVSANVNTLVEKERQGDELNELKYGDACCPVLYNSNSSTFSENPTNLSESPPVSSDGFSDVVNSPYSDLSLTSTKTSSPANSLGSSTISPLDGALNLGVLDYGNSSGISNASLERQHTLQTFAVADEETLRWATEPSEEYKHDAADSASKLENRHSAEQSAEQLSVENDYWFSEKKDVNHRYTNHNNEFDQEVMILSENSPYVHPKADKHNGAATTVASLLPDFSEKVIDVERQTSESVVSIKSFTAAGIPAPSMLSAALQVPPGKVLVPAVFDQNQGHVLAALQILKVVESDAQPGDLCTRREYARWLVTASNCLSRNATSKIYPAMYIENCTELAFDDITPEDRDFPYIQGLAEAGMISSKLSRSDLSSSVDAVDQSLFSPESPLSRQDLVSWKMAMEKRDLSRVDRNFLFKISGYIDIDKINPDAWPALAADLAAGDQSITALAFGFTRLFQPEKPVTKGQAALALSIGEAAEIVGGELARIEAEKLAEAAVSAHSALVAQVEKDLNESYENELLREKENIKTLERLVEEAKAEMESLRAEREVEKSTLFKGRAAVESEMEALIKLRCEVEEQLQNMTSNKVEIAFERDRISKLHKELEDENRAIMQLQYELEVERKALSMARVWAEEEARKAREHAQALEEARFRWERQGIKVVVDGELQEDASAGVTWITAGKEHPVDATISRAKSLILRLKSMAGELKLRSSAFIRRIIQIIVSFISTLKQQASMAADHCSELVMSTASAIRNSADELRKNAGELRSSVAERSRKLLEDCREGVEKSIEKISERFKA